MARRQASPRRRASSRSLAAIKEEVLVALETAITQFEAADLPFALVGGLAMGVRADPRVTRDVDFVLPVEDDAEAEARIYALQRRGFVVESVFERRGGRISTVRTRHSAAPDVLIDVLLSNARIEAEIVAAATPETVAGGIRCPVAQPWHLLAMKVYANRRKDQADLQELIERADEKSLEQTRRALELMRRRGVAPGRNLVAELEGHVSAVRQRQVERPAKSSRAARILRRNRLKAE